MPRIVCISDTHGFYQKVAVPDGDILIHSGDFGKRGSIDELPYFHEWLASQPHQYKIFVAGNHDWCFEREHGASRRLMTEVMYLRDSAVDILGLRVYGSPWQPAFNDWAFNLVRGEALAKVWAKIPVDTDILVTHCPPFGILDRPRGQAPVGCEDLYQRVQVIQPRLHCFGHIHEAYGERVIGSTTFVNSSVCNEHYDPCQQAVIVDLE